jgi:hypothetical protein
MHERIVRELPKKDLNVDEAANEALEVVEEMRELSDAFQVRKEIRDVATALGPLVAEVVDLQTPHDGVNRGGV